LIVAISEQECAYQKKYQRAYYQAHKAEYRARGKAWRKANPEKAKLLKRKHRNPVQSKRTTAAWRAAHPEQVASTAAKLKASRSTSIYRAQRATAMREARKTDIHISVAGRLRNAVRYALTAQSVRKGRHTEEYIGCTFEELKAHLEKQFLPGMTWENRRLWQIDHIRPCASFDLTQMAAQRSCFHYTNLRPMWASENNKKRAQWDGSSWSKGVRL
jgi:hypothetical protein